MDDEYAVQESRVDVGNGGRIESRRRKGRDLGLERLGGVKKLHERGRCLRHDGQRLNDNGERAPRGVLGAVAGDGRICCCCAQADEAEEQDQRVE